MLSKADTFLENGNQLEALQLYTRVTDLAPQETDAWYMQAAIYGELGKIDHAIFCCQKAIDLAPEDIDISIMLGRLFVEMDNIDGAISCLSSAVKNDPNSGEAWITLSGIYLLQENYLEAKNCAQQGIRLLPDQIDGYLNLGNALIHTDQIVEAHAISSRAIDIAPDSANAFFLLGITLEMLENQKEAIKAYSRAVSLDPDLMAAHAGLIRMHTISGNLAIAEKIFNQALAVQVNDANVHLAAGFLFAHKNEVATAEKFYRRALELSPKLTQAWIDLGNLLQDQDRHDEAEHCYKKAISISPHLAEAHFNLGVSLQRRALFDMALASFEKAIECKHELVDAHWYKSFICLLLGDYAQGWDEYEWRLRQKQCVNRPFQVPVWCGENLIDKTILIHDEQGYGDTFQFVRYLPLVKELGGQVIFECHPGLSAILAGCEGYDEIIERSSPQEIPKIKFDTHISLLSLPRVFGTRINSIPSNIPYITASSKRVDHWRKRIAFDENLKIGIAWAGSPNHTNELNRSCNLSEFKVITNIAGVSLYSLQKGPGQEQADNLPEGMNLIRLDREMDTDGKFVDTAALMSNLDLIISIDTSIVHLAGALGLPVWTLLCAAPDWRWQQESDNSPWYPTMRLFRQKTPGDWTSVFYEIEHLISELIKKRGSVNVNFD